MTPLPSFQIHGASILDEAGSFVDGLTIEVEDGVITRLGPERRTDLPTLDLAGRWLMPGVVDTHSHVFWNAFHATDRDAHPLTYRSYEALGSLRTTLEAGVTTVRDAGGADAGVRDAIEAGLVAGPRLRISDTILAADPPFTGYAGGPGAVDFMRSRVTEVLDRGADWVKLAATGGVTAPPGSDLESHYTEAEIQMAVKTAQERGKRVMVHAWGGPAIDYCISAGVGSIEHGMFLTDEQAHAAAARGITLVPTLTIYREVGEIAASGALPDHVAARARSVVEQHPLAVQRARDAGMPIALGSDFGTPDQHGRNLSEITALVEAGLSIEQALLSATRVGAELVGRGAGDAGGAGGVGRSVASAPVASAPVGRLAPGFGFDAIALRADPSDAAVFRDRSTIQHVWQAGIQHV